MHRLEAARTFFATLITANVGRSRSDHPLRMAFASTPRERFVGSGPWRVFTPVGYIETPSDDLSFLYQDITVALEQEGTINNGQPTLHALCISALSIQEGEAIVHIGAGSGYYTALLYVNAGATGPVQSWLDALRIGGRLLFPLTGAAISERCC